MPNERSPHAWADARPTRWKELGYMKLAEGCWRFVDLVATADNNKADTASGKPIMNHPSCVGPAYPSKAELLADCHRYGTDYGATAR